LRGRKDAEVFRFAQQERAVLLTADLGFANILHFPPGTHTGIVVAHFPNEVPVAVVNDGIARALRGLAEADLRGNLVMIEPGKVRIRRP
jgi:predicted nuclease of predicted toxin-antitoxin system